MTKRIAGYELIEALGTGAWGRSFKARQVSLDRLVHLTLLPHRKGASAVHTSARILASLTHPHLVSGIDLGRTESGGFLVTEWLEGPNVGDIVVRGGAIAEERATEIALAAAQALDHAARKGLIHGKVTPEAIVISQGGMPKLRGFAADRDAVDSERDWRSPEGRRGEPTDVRSDIYSLGAVFYWMLAGRHPFDDAPPAEVVAGEVIEVPFPLDRANRKLRPFTVETVEQMLSHEPEDRFSSAGELVAQLEVLRSQFDGSSGPRTRRPGVRRGRVSRARRRRRR